MGEISVPYMFFCASDSPPLFRNIRSGAIGNGIRRNCTNDYQFCSRGRVALAR
jgi:hypothetical protein